MDVRRANERRERERERETDTMYPLRSSAASILVHAKNLQPETMAAPGTKHDRHELYSGADQEGGGKLGQPREIEI